MKQVTCEDKARNFDLWGQYIDPAATMTEAEFDAMSIGEKIDLIHEMFPSECDCA